MCTNEGRDRDLNKHKLVLIPLDEPRKGETAKGETETKSLAKGETSRLSRPLRARQGNYVVAPDTVQQHLNENEIHTFLRKQSTVKLYRHFAQEIPQLPLRFVNENRDCSA